ncbi:hypothetical protein TraAM80_00632 [Trypanosoma rangeli]|uniref:Uncharacterized protein n=1 Tax=Trypanosoma rangeli TaxID=5698 RepID=A0A3R7MAG1_TRYRA|nr:uncharacterized protein TraAM80_00632 [Trypanosoma rangeli]RNF11937.1 hypothetical protein TraAM80_00632 [Trypanosoma rangeli]|eukprot:RNF11937.1 hypothetical protein TraAM80_00632 [Trypanosoma rangeli]
MVAASIAHASLSNSSTRTTRVLNGHSFKIASKATAHGAPTKASNPRLLPLDSLSLPSSMAGLNGFFFIQNHTPLLWVRRHATPHKLVPKGVWSVPKLLQRPCHCPATGNHCQAQHLWRGRQPLTATPLVDGVAVDALKAM